MAVHVSIHDVSPVFRREVLLALELCHAAGVKPALLVVPNYHGRAPLQDSPQFVDELKALANDGHEIMLHGFFHRTPRAPAGEQITSRAQRIFFQKIVSAGEAEFAHTTPNEARALLDDGERVLQEADLTSVGFVAPAWSKPKFMIDLLAARGVRYTEDHLRIYDPVKKRQKPSMVLNYASRSVSRMFSTVAYARIARPARRLFPTRIAIHPADMRFNLLRKECVSLLDWARGDFVSANQLMA